MTLEIGKKAPDFTLPSDSGKDISLHDYEKQKVILYFYPKDNTSGCTLEAKAFRDHLADFKALGYAVIGVSRDSVKKHCNFRDKNELNFPLLSDGEEKVVNLYGVLKEKSMYGRNTWALSVPPSSSMRKEIWSKNTEKSRPLPMWRIC